MTQLNNNLLTKLSSMISAPVLAGWIHSFKKEQEHQQKKINTPATSCTNTSWRNEGNVIQKARRNIRNQQETQDKPVQTTNKQENGNSQLSVDNKNESGLVTSKTLIKNKAVFFGQECELPYLHSSDAISHLYARKTNQPQTKDQVLFNPPSTIDRALLTSLKSLHIYHSGIESLRQLGTGWCNLKQLSIIHGKLCDLSGLSSFSSLEYLFVSINSITSLSDVMFNGTLRCIDFQRNSIYSMQQIEYLSTIQRLQSINLNDNPIMKVKENRRIIKQKFDKIIDQEEYTRLLEYELEKMTDYHQIMGYESLQVSNHLIKACNEALANDQINIAHLVQRQKENDHYNLDFVRYQKKGCQKNVFEKADPFQIQEEEEIIFTPLFHFIDGRKHFTNILKKYVENKLYITSKKVENNASSQSPAHAVNTLISSSRLNKFTASTKLQRNQQIYSLDKMQSLTTDLNSLDKGKRTRLSLGKTRRLLQKLDKDKPASTLAHTKLVSTFTSSSSKPVMSLKRTSLLKKASVNDLQVEIQKKFSKTMAFRGQE